MVYVCVLWSMIRYKGVMLNQQAKTMLAHCTCAYMPCCGLGQRRSHSLKAVCF